MFKPRSPVKLPDAAVRHFASIIAATSIASVEAALESLEVYDASVRKFHSWQATAKLFDDWRCVVSGPFAKILWQSHTTSHLSPADANQHGLWLCWGCHIASLWGPCEHAYSCMEHEGQSNACSLPQTKKKGRPPKQPGTPSTYPPVRSPLLHLSLRQSDHTTQLSCPCCGLSRLATSTLQCRSKVSPSPPCVISLFLISSHSSA